MTPVSSIESQEPHLAYRNYFSSRSLTEIDTQALRERTFLDGNATLNPIDRGENDPNWTQF